MPGTDCKCLYSKRTWIKTVSRKAWNHLIVLYASCNSHPAISCLGSSRGIAFRSTCSLKPLLEADQCSRKNIVFEIREPFEWHLLFSCWATWHKLHKPVWASLSSSIQWECAIKSKGSKSAQHSVKHIRCLTDARSFPYSLWQWFTKAPMTNSR